MKFLRSPRIPDQPLALVEVHTEIGAGWSVSAESVQLGRVRLRVLEMSLLGCI
jgi:hypothetical protein